MMKNFKVLLYALAFSMVSSGIIAMEAYKPKVYISNRNTTSLVGASVGIKCIINGVSPNVRTQEGMAFFVPVGEDKAIGQLGIDLKTDIVSLDLQPSSAGTGCLSGKGKVTVYPLTDHLNAMLTELNQHANQDIVIVVDNNTYSGYWQFQFLWRDRMYAQAMPIQEVAQEQAQRPAPKGGPAKTIGKKYEPKSISTVTKQLVGQCSSSMWQAMQSEDVMQQLQEALKKRKAALEG